MKEGIFLGLGANLDDPASQLRMAINHLKQRGVETLTMSSFYSTKAWGYIDQPDFINVVLMLDSRITPDPYALLDVCMGVEQAMGRIRTGPRWGPRLIDIDILAYNQLQVADSRITIPHPELSTRAFVLVPWREIAPSYEVPGTVLTVQLLADALPVKEIEAVTRLTIL